MSILLALPPFLLGLLYGGGYLAQFMRNYSRWQAAGGTPGDGTSPVTPSLNIRSCFEAIFTMPYGIIGILICVGVLALLIVMVMRMGYSETGEYDKDRNFIYSRKGTYGTSGFMSEKEAEEIFDITPNIKTHTGTIFGMLDGKFICMPNDSMLNRNVAVYGASGSMKTRAYCINRILQAAHGPEGQRESLIICDPKSELYEKTSEYLRKTHVVKVFNLVSPENSDSWNCLAEIEGDELMAQRFCDVIIKNTGNERGDHFWDSSELNLLKALVLYVEQGYPPERKNIGEVYKLLTHSGEKELNSLFDMLPPSHPAKAPYAIFKQASDTVRSGVIIGLGSRLQVFQNKAICNMTAHDEIDLELPGQKPCAYFCITSDQDSTFDFLSSLFLSFVFIKLVRYADRNCPGGKLPVPVHVLGEELTACGVIPDLSRKISVIRSRNISMSCVFQNLAGLQNRYPYNQWQEILGNSDVQLFLGCVDELTAKYISDRSGEVSVHVQSKAKMLGTWRISNYTPEFRETSGVGKRKLLTMDEVLRLPINKALIIIRGKKLLQVDKCDYTRHPDSKNLSPCKASAHIPEWQKQKPKEVDDTPPVPVKKPGRKKKSPVSTVVPTDKDSIMSKN
ncbi:MAG: VirD4-like conjugal transfer protein, CD1115 family [Acutalibacteraceae bacterium]